MHTGSLWRDRGKIHMYLIIQGFNNFFFSFLFSHKETDRKQTHVQVHVCVCVKEREKSRPDQTRPEPDKTKNKRNTETFSLFESLLSVFLLPFSSTPQFLLRLLPCDVLQLWLLRRSLKFASDCIGVPASVYGSEIAALSFNSPTITLNQLESYHCTHMCVCVCVCVGVSDKALMNNERNHKELTNVKRILPSLLLLSLFILSASAHALLAMFIYFAK